MRLEQSGATGSEDLDLQFGQRARWVLSENWPGKPLLLVNGRFVAETVNSLESARVRSLGLRLDFDAADLTVEVGRRPVLYGGARLVDGIQALRGLEGGLEVGGWSGIAPDLFTTAPTPRLGGGPIIAYGREDKGQISLVGEVLWAPSGLDRAGALLLGQRHWGTVATLHSRLDVQVTDSRGKVGLVDAALFGRWNPTQSTRIDAFYNAYSSWRYLSTADLDPAVRRFDARSDTLGLSEDIPQETLDDSLHHLLGASGRWTGDLASGNPYPEVGLDLRLRHHADEINRFNRITPHVALADLVDGRLRLELDASRLVSRGVSLGEAGLTTSYFPGKEERLLLDSSMRLMFDTPTVGIGSGWYADLFVDWVSMGGVVVSSGVHGIMERDEDFLDTGYGVLGRLSWHTGGKRSQRRSRTPWWGFAHRDGGS